MSDEQPVIDRLEDIVVGLVAPVGTDLGHVGGAIARSFERLGYSPHHIKLSTLLDEVPDGVSDAIDGDDEYVRYDTYMNAGNKFRARMRRGDALSMLAVGAIRELRNQSTNVRNVFILRSLKHQDEVKSLRNIYGPAFVLFSLASRRSIRVNNLARKICKSRQKFDFSECLPEAEILVNRDQSEADNPMGQNVRKVFPLADFFVDADRNLDASVKRLVELFLGNIFITPTRDEYGMFLAHSAAWRSASLQRQVGAVIATQDGNVVSVGTNEVPKPGGGLYWDGDVPDSRDFQHGGEINDDMKNRMFAEVIQRLINSGMKYVEGHELANVESPQEIAEWLISNSHMVNTRIMGVIEFGRCVHAEMAALMDAARRGVAVNNSYLFSTTFPCHECARHIVAAGVRKVYYIEPYPKSLVNELYPDSIRVEGEGQGDLVTFAPFVGVAPRRFQDVFKLGDVDRKDALAHAHDWNSGVAMPRLGEYPDRTQMINRMTEAASFDKFSAEFQEATNEVK